MSSSQFDRRTFLTVGTIGIAAAAVGARAVMAQDQKEEEEETGAEAAGATPGATPGASPTAGAVVEVNAVDINFEPKTLEIPADTDVQIKVTNKGNLQHDFTLEDTDYATDLLDGGDSQTLTVNLKAGDYTYYCSVPGHREAGMEGKLTAK